MAEEKKVTNISVNVENFGDIDKLTKDVYDNFPEYSMSLQCMKWEYDKFNFVFYDEDEGKKYTVNFETARKGVIKLIEDWLNHKCHFYGISEISDLMDPCCWDANVGDAAVQYAIFGELIYG